MIPRSELTESAVGFFEKNSRSVYIKSQRGFEDHCYKVAGTSEYLAGKVFDNYGDVISDLLDPTNVLGSHNIKEEFLKGADASGLLHDIGDAIVTDEAQIIATHVGEHILEIYGFPKDVTGPVGSSWVAKEELQVAQDSIRNGPAPQVQEKTKGRIMTLNPDDYVQNSVQQLIGSAADIGDDFDSMLKSYIKRRTFWGHDTLVEALILGKERLKDVYELANKLVEGELNPEQVREIGVIPLY